MAITRINVITYNAPGSYTYIPSIGMRNVMVEVLAGGGASGSTSSTTPDGVTATPGAGAGGYAKSIYSAGFIDAKTVIVVVGSGGQLNPSPLGLQGGDGGSSSFGQYMICTGGIGQRQLSSLSTAWSSTAHLGHGGVAAGGNVFNVDGQTGGATIELADGSLPTIPIVSFAVSGAGGSTIYGNGGSAVSITSYAPKVTINGNPGTGYGAGASGGASFQGGTVALGANGAPGLVIITEYIQ